MEIKQILKLKTIYTIAIAFMIIIFILNIVSLSTQIRKTSKYKLDKTLLEDEDYLKENSISINHSSLFKNFNKFEKGVLISRMVFLTISLISCTYLTIQQYSTYINAKVCNLFYTVKNIICITFCFIYFILSLVKMIIISIIKKTNKNINKKMNNLKYPENSEINWKNSYTYINNSFNDRCNLQMVLDFLIFFICLLSIFLYLLGLLKINERLGDTEEETYTEDEIEKKGGAIIIDKSKITKEQYIIEGHHKNNSNEKSDLIENSKINSKPVINDNDKSNKNDDTK